MLRLPTSGPDAGTDHRGVTFIVPCLDEGPEVVARTVERLRLAAAQRPHEIIVVDDGSVRSPVDAAKLPPEVRVARHKVNRGYGASLATGLRLARFPWIGMIDADGTYPVESFGRMFDLIPEYDMIVGARRWSDIGRLRRIPKRCLTWLGGYLADRPIPDLNSGMRLFHRDIYFGHRRIYPERFSFSSTLTMVGLTGGFDVHFLEIDYFQRIGHSTIHPLRDPIRFAYQLLRLSLYFRPLRIFLPLGGAIGLAAVARGLRDLHVGDHFGGLTLVLFFMAFQVFFFGLIAEIINKK